MVVRLVPVTARIFRVRMALPVCSFVLVSIIGLFGLLLETWSARLATGTYRSTVGSCDQW